MRMALNMNSVMLNSEDYQKLADFYGQVLQKDPEMSDDTNGYIGYLAGNCFLSIGKHDKVHGKSQNPERTMIFFETADVQGEFERIKNIAGASVVKEPYSPDGAGKFYIATLADCDGNYFQLASPWDTK
jgi:predicted enzyme related to lactoylglutathione lyase